MKLFINEIIVDERIRKGTGANIKELADDIKKNGQIQPITVRIDDSGAYRLVTGFRRMMAMRALGENQIEAYVISEADEEKLLQMEISENEVREGFTRTERMEYIRRLEEIERAKAKERQGKRNIPQNYAESGDHRDKVAETVGISHDTIAREKTIIEHKGEIDPEDFKNWDEGKLSTNKVFSELKKKLTETEHALTEAKSKPGKIVREIPGDYEELKNRAAEAERMEKLLRKDNDRLLKELAKIEQKAKESEKETVTGKAEDDTEWLILGIQSFLRSYGSRVWGADIGTKNKGALLKQAENLLGFATNLYELVKEGK